MEISPQHVYTLSIRRHKAKIKWYYRDDMDGQKFTLEVAQKDVGYGVPGGVDSFLATLPMTVGLEEGQRLLHGVFSQAQVAGWRIDAEPMENDW
jgi:hypothetical protein